ncbi:MAG: DUF2855 family protein [Pseudomonadota bacterium]
MTGWALEIDRNDITKADIVEDEPRPLQPGEARLTIRRFALTANNITYAAFGEAMQYWAFFPASNAARGRLPVWGFAEVAESQAEGLKTGERIYGYFPAASGFVVSVAGLSARSFKDAAPHRAELPPAYNRYVRCAGDPAYDFASEPEQMVLQPLFLTSFLIARELQAQPGATPVLTSASSKTAIALASLLAEAGVSGTVGLTSERNRAFVEGLGLYDRVHAYEEIEALGDLDAIRVIDFAGDSAVNRAIHTAHAERLEANIRVGGAHWENSAPARDLPGPKPVFFFAPSSLEHTIKEIGREAFEADYSRAWRAFSESAKTWCAFQAHHGPDGALKLYEGLANQSIAMTGGAYVEL